MFVGEGWMRVLRWQKEARLNSRGVCGPEVDAPVFEGCASPREAKTQRGGQLQE